MRLGQRHQCVPGGKIAAEDVDAARRHLRLHEPPIERPEEVRREPGPPRVVARGAHAADDIAGTLLEAAEELHGELRRLLQIRRHHGEVRARSFGETGANCRERTEVARHLEELCGETGARQQLDEASERAIRAAVDDEDDFEIAAERAVHVRERHEEIRNHLLVAVDGNYERVAGCHRLHAAATASISESVSSG